MLTRRAAVLSAVAAVPLSAVGTRAAPSATPRRAVPARLGLPAPSGPHPVGSAALHLVDTSRADPWVTTRPYRELMIGIRYPARAVRGHPRAPQMLPGEAAGFAAVNNLAQVPGDKVDWAATRTHAHGGAPAVQFPGGRVERTVLPAEFDKAYPDPVRIRALLRKTTAVRVADTRFLPDGLPEELHSLPDWHRLGMFGDSAGGVPRAVPPDR